MIRRGRLPEDLRQARYGYGGYGELDPKDAAREGEEFEDD